MKFEINTVTFLAIIVVTIIAWAGFEFFHRSNELGINPDLIRHSQTPIDNSFDTTTLKKIYESKDKYYESITPTPTTAQ